MGEITLRIRPIPLLVVLLVLLGAWGAYQWVTTQALAKDAYSAYAATCLGWSADHGITEPSSVARLCGDQWETPYQSLIMDCYRQTQGLAPRWERCLQSVGALPGG